ncbi:RibD family protein [Antribacter gilvus]|uniref:RibD family protein n=1 Tax=Antribacter gilvus TaxID=2304675 RepID=UPI000F788D56|nr:dihydrofolate reductase family protein [Antribacter gilvus]
MTDRPYVLLSVATSLDGYIDDASAERLVLSNDEDLDRVDEVRAGVDAILVGASTIRADDPRLLVRSADRRAKRLADGRPGSPLKVTVTARGDLDPDAQFFTAGDGDKIVYTTTGAAPELERRLASAAVVVGLGPEVAPGALLRDLAARGVERLLVEGGSTMHTMFLAAGLVDELHLVLAPFFVGDERAPRFVNPARFPQSSSRRMALAETRQLGDCVLLRYVPEP